MNAFEKELTSEYELKGQTVLEQESSVSTAYLLVKRVLDFVFALLAIVILSPLFLLIIVMIKATSKGPAIFKQKRVGKGGKTFVIYKFRTMVKGAENISMFLSPELVKRYEINRKLVNDPRVTKCGKILRRTSLDELPQIINILKGEMSFVGPRPMLPEEIKLYGSSYHKYITVKPGLTGLWQIKSRNQTTMDQRARLDMEYVQKRCLIYDLWILFKTVKVVFSKKGAC